MQSVTFTINSDGTWSVLLNGQPVGTVLAFSTRYSPDKPGVPPVAMYLLLNNDTAGQATMATLSALNLPWLMCTCTPPNTPVTPSSKAKPASVSKSKAPPPLPKAAAKK